MATFSRNVPICLLSKTQDSVILLSSVAKFIMISGAEKEIIFVTQLLESMETKFTYPIPTIKQQQLIPSMLTSAISMPMNMSKMG